MVGVRPEHIVHDPTGATLRGTTLIVEPTGAQTHVTFELADEPYVAVLDGETALRPGEPFAGTVSPEAIHLFDTESGNSITPRRTRV